MTSVSWTVAAIVIVVLLAVTMVFAWLVRKPRKPRALPSVWALTARPVFSTDERRVYRLLREALPHHIILSKLPLVRFCQPVDPEEVRYWFELLGSSHVSFAVCSANGRVLAVLDLDTERGISRRNLQIKQSVLGACKVRYVRCSIDRLPSLAELQMLVPSGPAWNRGPQVAPAGPREVRGTSSGVSPRRADRSPLWQDSTVFHDSFFAPESRVDFPGSHEMEINDDVVDAPVDPRGRNRPARGLARNLTANPDEAVEDDLAGAMFDVARQASSRY